MADKRISYKVGGKVQGVNFRKFTVKQAKRIGITGFVRNASDGSVIGEAQGSDKALKEFIQHLNKGPLAASVTSIEHSYIDTKRGESGFSAR
ncbi:Acylphosphatase [Lepidopterella palustris CBS 459.81]|uniref:Acylphosphatase n=1 Tax=Lepidopterella palustris CBS 459.81 TaxID=1314670 RepID=A0A8E2JIB7_9PEZI|nr:Acylphosphatase [Lepidopterella palustris CBS 459.81]